MTSPPTTTLRRAARGGFERSLLASAGLHATVLGLLAAAGTVAALGEVSARRSAVVRLSPPTVDLVAAVAGPVEEVRPLDEVEVPEPRVRPAAVPEPLPAPAPAADPALEPLPDAERLWETLVHATLREPEPESQQEEAEPAPPPPPDPPAAAQDSPASTASEGPTRGARPVHAPPPTYPRASLRLGEQGAVLCRLHVGPGGHVAHVELVRSSGHERLDEAALAALRTWRFEPALAAGVAVPEVYPHRVVFRLDGS